MMTLHKWAEIHQLGLRAVAQLLGVDRSLAHKWLAGETIPSAQNMRSIYRKTDGEVEPNDFYDLPRIRPRRRSTSAAPAALGSAE
jgi:DNA-binding transcriptional regulator YdaS (Cro superfamily)